MNRIVLLCLAGMFFLNAGVYAGKEKKKKVKTTTSYITVTEHGKQLSYKDTYEEFDKNGNCVVKIEYDKSGQIQKKQTARFDNLGNKIEETDYNPNGTIQKKTVMTYNATGERATELVTDGSGKFVKKFVYTYNAKELKATRQTLNSSNVQESVKKWDYTFY